MKITAAILAFAVCVQAERCPGFGYKVHVPEHGELSDDQIHALGRQNFRFGQQLTPELKQEVVGGCKPVPPPCAKPIPPPCEKPVVHPVVVATATEVVAAHPTAAPEEPEHEEHEESSHEEEKEIVTTSPITKRTKSDAINVSMGVSALALAFSAIFLF